MYVQAMMQMQQGMQTLQGRGLMPPGPAGNPYAAGMGGMYGNPWGGMGGMGGDPSQMAAMMQNPMMQQMMQQMLSDPQALDQVGSAVVDVHLLCLLLLLIQLYLQPLVLVLLTTTMLYTYLISTVEYILV